MERLDISGQGEQHDPVEIAIAELQGPGDLAFIDAIRARSKAVTEGGSNPSTHPLRRIGIENLTMTTGREEVIKP